jgi:hypothetical protein
MHMKCILIKLIELLFWFSFKKDKEIIFMGQLAHPPYILEDRTKKIIERDDVQYCALQTA